MNKIKQINISNFRIYQEKQEFRFQNKEGVANLVALYAPNGYGKTSFFDAIEWGYSDKIKRIGEKNEADVKELDYNKDLKDKIILTNRNSYKNDPNAKGEVEIITEKGSLKKRVKLYTRRNTNGTQNDYNKGENIGDLKLKDVNKLVEHNILTQEQIDAFLRYLSAQDRFNELKEFWAEGEESLYKYGKIQKTIENIDKKIGEIKPERDRLQKELGKIIFDPQRIKSLNSELAKLELSEIDVDNLIKIQEPLKEEILKELTKQLVELKQRNKETIEKKEERLLQIKGLIEGFPFYTTNTAKLKEENKKLLGIRTKDKLYTDLKVAKKQKTDIEKHLFEKRETLKDFKLIDELKSCFLEIESRISDLKKNEKKCSNEIKLIELDEINIEKWIDLLSNAQTKCENRFEEVEKKEEKLKIQSKIYFKDLEKNHKNREEISKSEKQFSFLEKEIESSQKKIQLYQQNLNQEKWGKELLESKEWDGRVDEYNTKKNQLEGKIKELKTNELKLQKLDNLQENLNKIRLWGKDYIEKTKDNKCPLCHSSFVDFDALIYEIEIDKKNLAAIEQKDFIEALEKQISSLKKDIKELNDFFTEKLNAEINKIKSKIENRYSLKEEEKRKQNNFKKEIDNFAITYTSFFALLEDLNKGEKVTEEIIPSLIEKITEEKDKLNNRSVRLKTVLEWKYDFLAAKKTTEKALEKKQLLNKQERLKQENDEEYKSIIELLQKHRIASAEIKDDVKIKSLISFKMIEEKEINGGYTAVNKLIEDFDCKIKHSSCTFEEIELQGMLVEKKYLIDQLKKDIKYYEDSYKKQIQSPTYTIDELNDKFKTCEEKLEQHKSYMPIFTSLEADLEIINTGARKLEIKKQIESLVAQETSLSDLKTKVQELRESCMNYIQEGISMHFNTEVINSIYKKIEPHPELKEIGFRAEIRKEKPVLKITAKGALDEINPVLYLSAGQVNVLSLSIFLARAFQYADDQISTIFMDDPIQNLSDINILSFIDILRTLTNEHNKQIVISTHDEKFFRLLQKKLPEDYSSSKYIEFESEGLLKKNEEFPPAFI